MELALPALAPACSRRPRLLSLWRRRPGGRRRFAWPSTRRIGRGHHPGPALALLETFVEFFSLLGREHFADFLARLAKFPAQFRLQQFPKHLRPFLAFTHDRVEPLVLFRSQRQKPGETAQHLDPPELRSGHRLRLAGLFHQQTAGENTGAEDDHGRQDDLPGVHQLLSTSSPDARSVCSKSSERLAPERGRFKPEKDQTLSRTVTATQAAAPRQSAAPHCDRASATRRAASRARIRFSNAYS